MECRNILRMARVQLVCEDKSADYTSFKASKALLNSPALRLLLRQTRGGCSSNLILWTSYH